LIINTPRICIPIVSLSQAVAPLELFADLFEVRIDLVGTEWRSIISSLNKPWIACNRRAEEGGKWKGAEEKRIKELLSALDLGAQYIDIELGSLGVKEVVKAVKGRAQIIISYHDLQGTPPASRLKQIVVDELAVGADICKVVTTAHNIKDNVAVLDLIGAVPGVKIISFAMGAEGQISRIISPLAGGYLTWASAEDGSESAPGQITAEDVTKIYSMLGKM
jgi:3-dehydroquinate dehydratase type I